jgi:hypothetical protein
MGRCWPGAPYVSSETFHSRGGNLHPLPDIVCYGVIIAGLSVIQSVFGIGLLLLGTPIFLLTGQGFGEALWALLPASLAVSLLQLACDKGLRWPALRSFALFAVPTLAIGLMIALSVKAQFKIDLLVGLALIAGAILRLHTRVRKIALKWLAKRENAALAGIGFVHGLTNMGGGLLSLYASIRHVEKHDIRQHIALGYGTFASAQLGLLALTSFAPEALQDGLIYAAIAATVFLSIGRGAFTRVPAAHYSILFSIFEVGCGSVLIAKWLGTPLLHF